MGQVVGVLTLVCVKIPNPNRTHNGTLLSLHGRGLSYVTLNIANDPHPS